MEFMIFRLLIFIAVASSRLSIYIIYSQEADPELSSQIFNDLNVFFDGKIDIYQESASEASLIGANYMHPTIIIDITKNLLIKQIIKESSSIYEFIVISLDDHTKDCTEWEYCSHISVNNHAEALISMLSYLNWTRFGITYSDSSYNINFYNYFKEKLFFKSGIIASSLNLGNEISQDLSDKFALREIKGKGLLNLIIINEGEGAQKIGSSLISGNMYKNNFGVILGSKAIWGPNNDGLIFLVEKGLESAKSLNHYHSLSIIKLLSSIDISSESIYFINEKLRNITVNQSPENYFSIVNIQAGSKKIVGEIQNNKIILNSELYFPGNTTTVPQSIKPPVVLSIASGNSNFNGVVLGSNSYIKIGAFFAMIYAKYIHFLDDFNLSLHPTDCSADFYFKPFSYSCLLKQKSNLGLAFFPSYNDNVCYGTISDFRALGIKIPLISDQCTSEIFTNKTAYPEFVRITKSFAFHSNTLAYLMKIFNWNCAIVFYENSTFGLDMYKSFSSVANSLGIKIVNDEDKRMLDPLYAPDLYKNYSDYMRNAIKTDCKIIVPLLQPTPLFNLFGQLYDEGMRKGDFIYLLYFPIVGYFEYSQVITNKTRENVKELAAGAITLWQSEWIGSYGASLIEIGNKFYGSFLYGGTCTPFDAVMLGLNGIKYLIDTGEDYEDPELLNAGIRKVRFTGCSGTVQISSNSNEKSTALISIWNEVYNETQKRLTNVEVGSYSIGRNPAFAFTAAITWPDNSANIPGQKRLNPDDCPFNLHLIRSSNVGKTLYYVFVWGIAIIVAVLSGIFLIKFYWRTRFPILRKKCEITVNDYITIVMIFIDFLQYLAMGPDIRAYDKISSILYDYAAVNLSEIIHFKNGAYWLAIIFTFSVCYLWLLLSGFLYLRIFEWKNIELFDNIGVLAKFITPIIGNLGLIPIAHILLTIFQCENGIGNKLSDTYMSHDCSVYCYKSPHIFFIILSAITLLIYLPLSILCRPLWHSISFNANVYSNPSYLVAKSIFQIIAVALNKTLKRYSQSLEGLIYLIFSIFLIIFMIYHKPYNYERYNLWAVISLIALSWSLILSSLYYIVPYLDYKFWIILQFGGWLIIILFALYFQHKKLPSLLFSAKGVEISIFFKFALSKQIMLEEVIKERSKAYEICIDESRIMNEVSSKNELIDSNS
ncbi:unnamed protein product [Blepharisma stoltei]|uniref:Receptor ligand binding region domain-containing protein n=1 Tax=Blepharisma stoltei TaxID=1481888 RepID=A0AAU9IJY3_9CILI|nr:unnamed protein product [Blepharisma stoltei]